MPSTCWTACARWNCRINLYEAAIQIPGGSRQKDGSVACVSVAPNCASDEGGPFGVGNHELIPSHRKLLCPKTMAVSVTETPGQDPGR
jgi:hypothetical protein